ncbi:hypothetical protein J8281_03565 [Aquimarina sp. U1-2]|uniref:hypothetical protein n=1 Tax=Aquimarina sp. U1-2 TaxID=2823141 RepID=UPI001AECB907|nr:hypothetical protein [Aquimarina sp. U1-2]MBP2831256.1 hypothetical protein [Aquimarina sp. U1-2]
MLPEEERKIEAFNEIWLLIEADQGIHIRSDYGEYNESNKGLSENSQEHADEISILNTTENPKKVIFLQIIMQ